jgi:hypothetical protein
MKFKAPAAQTSLRSLRKFGCVRGFSFSKAPLPASAPCRAKAKKEAANAAASLAHKLTARRAGRAAQQGAHQQRPAGPHTQCRPARQLAPGPPQAVLMIGVKFFAVAARFPAPFQLAASAFQASAPVNRIAAAAASTITLRMRLLPILSISAKSFRRFCQKGDAVECRRTALQRP